MKIAGMDFTTSISKVLGIVKTLVREVCSIAIGENSASYSPSSDANDGGWYTGPTSGVDAGGIATVGNSGSGYTNGCWILFNNVTIPNKAGIREATLEVTSYSDKSLTTVNLKIAAHAVDDGTVPSNWTNMESKLSEKTTAQVAWSGISAWTQFSENAAPDIASVIQEIVNRAGWASGNDILIFIFDNSSSSGATREIETSGSYPATLAVRWV